MKKFHEKLVEIALFPVKFYRKYIRNMPWRHSGNGGYSVASFFPFGGSCVAIPFQRAATIRFPGAKEKNEKINNYFL